jgi:hypothetical protein
MNIITIIAQVLGIGGMACAILSMQCRSNRIFFIVQGTAGLLFTISFVMLGAWSGAIMNIFSLVRACVLNNRKIAGLKATLVGFIAVLILCSVLLLWYFQEKWYLVLIVFLAQMAANFVMWSQNGKLIRHVQLAVISPLWLLYNCVIPIPSIGGFLTETLNIISVTVSLIRYRKIGFTK